jgi:acetyltransferase-like isoleucine patch superfamily enzyme
MSGPNKSNQIPLYFVAMTYLPLLFLITGLFLAAYTSSIPIAVTAFLLWLYLVPPLVCRLVIALWGLPITESATQNNHAYKVWWLLTQLQMPFNRIGLLEELLRLVPGLYSAWLNLWGARVSLFTFWARDVLISERYLLTIEPNVVMASQTGIAGHLVDRDKDGQLILVVAPVVIERGAMLGIRSGLGPGCRLFSGEVLPAGRILPPFTGWQKGRKIRLDSKSQ